MEDTKGTEDGKEVTVEEVIGEEVTAEDGEEAAVVEAGRSRAIIALEEGARRVPPPPNAEEFYDSLS